MCSAAQPATILAIYNQAWPSYTQSPDGCADRQISRAKKDLSQAQAAQTSQTWTTADWNSWRSMTPDEKLRWTESANAEEADRVALLESEHQRILQMEVQQLRRGKFPGHSQSLFNSDSFTQLWRGDPTL